MRTTPYSEPSVVKDNSSLDGRFVLHRLKAFRPLVKPEGLVDNTLHVHLAGVEIVDGGGELINFTEASQDSDLVTDFKPMC